MSSSTSNSNRPPKGAASFANKHMISISVLVGVLLLGAYSLLLESDMFRYGGGVGSTDIENCQIRAERYLFDIKEPKTVMIGTSRSARIRTDLLNEDFYNLAFPCLSGVIGISVVEKKPTKPQKVLIELNDLLFSESLEMMKDLFTLYEFKKVFKFMRTEYRPIVLMKKLLQPDAKVAHWFLPQRVDTKTHKVIATGDAADGLKNQAPHMLLLPNSEWSRMTSSVVASATPHQTNRLDEHSESKIPQGVIDYYEEYFAKAMATPGDRLRRYIEFVRALRQGGTEVQFVWIPELYSVEAYNRFLMSRYLVKIPFPDIEVIRDFKHPYEFSDGLHMDDLSSNIYTKFLSKQL